MLFNADSTRIWRLEVGHQRLWTDARQRNSKRFYRHVPLFTVYSHVFAVVDFPSDTKKQTRKQKTKYLIWKFAISHFTVTLMDTNHGNLTAEWVHVTLVVHSPHDVYKMRCWMPISNFQLPDSERIVFLRIRYPGTRIKAVQLIVCENVFEIRCGFDRHL